MAEQPRNPDYKHVANSDVQDFTTSGQRSDDYAPAADSGRHKIYATSASQEYQAGEEEGMAPAEDEATNVENAGIDYAPQEGQDQYTDTGGAPVPQD